MYGGVGTGKTMLMDLFAESAPSEFQASPCHTERQNACTCYSAACNTGSIETGWCCTCMLL